MVITNLCYYALIVFPNCGVYVDIGILGFVFSGLVVGFIVGLTGVGGGSLMTPLLLWFGINPATAVGTDLLYAAITKSSGVIAHQRNNNINWRIAGLLSLGSIPASLFALWLLTKFHADSHAQESIIKQALGYVLVLTALAIFFKKQLLAYSQKSIISTKNIPPNVYTGLTVLTGVVLGIIVSLTSIGAGALGTVALFMLYPLLTSRRLVGTEIAHAVPLTLIAGLGHASMGNVDWHLLIYLLIGSLPGVYIGGSLSGRIPESVLRPCMALMLLGVGYNLVV